MTQSVRCLLITAMYLLACTCSSYAQFLSAKKSVVVSPDSNKVFLSFFTNPESITVSHADSSLSSDVFSFDVPSGFLTFHWPQQWTSLPVELHIEWMYRPANIPGSITSPFGVLYTPNDSLNRVSGNTESGNEESYIYESTLVSTGSITRGVIVGNARDPGLESGLNFNLQGRLTENIQLIASLSDQNAIIQPEGTTQNLREFDQVFIRIQAPNEQIQMGDVDAGFKQSSIAQLQRRIQGAVLSSDRDATGSNQAVLSVQRGTFRVMELRGREGIQGPYRLTGERGESFIIVVAGTERVFLDGRLLERGEDLDYIIDYSIGEITFTGANLVRSSHRIRIEFQYLSSSYSRTLFAAESEQNFGAKNQFSIGATFIREADALNFAESSFLSEEDLDVIRQAGADENRMRVPGADSVGYRPDASYALYVARDTLISGEVVRYYEFRPGDPQAVFRVSFTRVGQSAGSYRRVSGGLNGIVYEWVGPGNGDYEPFRQLTGPKQTQLMAVRVKARLFSGLETSAEWAGSSFNPNRLATGINGRQDQMVRGRIGLVNQDIGIGTVSAGAEMEYKGMNFRFFDRVRDPEFDRLWGLQGAVNSDETRYQSNLIWALSPATEFLYDFQKLNRSDRNGVRHDVSIRSEEASLPFINAQFGILDSESHQQTTAKSEVQDISVQMGYNVVLGSVFLTPELRIVRDLELFKENTGEYRFGHEYGTLQPSLSLRTSDGNSFSIGYQIRDESEVVGGSLIESRFIKTPEIRLAYSTGVGFSTDTRIGLQQTSVTDIYSQLTGSSDTKGLAARSVTAFSLTNEGITNEIIYDLNTESRSLFQETYLEVGSEFGQYVWIDLNNDQVQQLDEFFSEQNPNEGTFILQLLPTDELRPVTSLRTSWSLRVDPIRWITNWREGKIVTRILANMIYTSRIDFREQSETDNLTGFALMKPQEMLQESTTLQGNLNWRQELQFFRRIPTVDVSLRRNFRKRLSRQLSGLQSSDAENWTLIGTYRFPENWSIELDLSSQQRNSTSESLSGRNYSISGWSFEPRVRYNFGGGSISRIGIKYVSNEDANEARATLFNIFQDGSVYLGSRLRILERVEFRSTRISKSVGPQLEFELTESIGVGNSILWNLGIQWDNTDWVRTTIQYDGRTIPGRGIIQTFKVAVTALF